MLASSTPAFIMTRYLPLIQCMIHSPHTTDPARRLCVSRIHILDINHDSLAVIDHGESNLGIISPTLLSERKVTSLLLPLSKLKQETHVWLAAISVEDSLERIRVLIGGKVRTGNLSDSFGLVVPGWSPSVEVFSGEEIGSVATITKVRAGRPLDLQHAASGAGGDVLKDEGGLAGVGAWTAGACEGKLATSIALVGVGFVEDVYPRGCHSSAGTRDEIVGGRWSGVGEESRGKEEGESLRIHDGCVLR